MDLTIYADLTDATGAVNILSQRFNRPYNAEALHWHVKNGKLRALMFVNGVLVERASSVNRRGRDLIFLRSDLEAFQEPKRGPVSQSTNTHHKKA